MCLVQVFRIERPNFKLPRSQLKTVVVVGAIWAQASDIAAADFVVDVTLNLRLPLDVFLRLAYIGGYVEIQGVD